MDNIQKIIKDIGFDDKEAIVYLACLELNSAPNTQIAKKTHLNRITNYEILKRLESKGVITSFKKRHAKNFIAIDPRILIKQAKEKILLAEKSLPELLSISNKLVKKPKIYFFEGIDGIKTIYEDSLNARTGILTFTNPNDLYYFLGRKYMENYVKERARRNIKVKGLAPDDEAGKEAKDIGNIVLRDTKLFPKEKYQIQNEIMIYDDKIAVFSGKDKIGLIIENEALSSTFRNIWQMNWDSREA